MPKVTIAIPVYNDAKFLHEALDSIFAQTFSDFELLVVDDGSTDATLSILTSYSDKRLRIIRHEANQGRPFARNTALNAANGEYLAWMDGDDTCHAQRIEKQVAFLDAHAEIDICGCDLQCFHERKNIVYYPHTTEQVRAGIIWDSTIPNAASCMRLSSVRKARLRYREDQLRVEDYSFWLDALLGASLRAVNIPDVLFHWRYFHRPTSMAYHALAARHVLSYLGLPDDLHHATLHAMLSCTSDEGLKPVDASEVIHWANEIYQAVLRSRLVSMQAFLPLAHVKIEKYLSWQPLSRVLLQEYCSSPLGRTHSLSRLCAIVMARKIRRAASSLVRQ